MLLGDVFVSDLETAMGGYFILFLGLGALLIVIGSRISLGTEQSHDAIFIQ
jgi:hypothetical protein